MAKYSKRRKPGKRKTSRRRSVGALALNPSSQLVQLGSVAIGYLMATSINGAIDKVVPTNVDAKLVAAGQVGLGAALVMSKKKSLVKTVAGGVMAGAGLKRALTAFGIGGFRNVPAVGNFRNVPAIGARRMSGYTTSAATNLAGYNTSRVPVTAYGNSMGSDLLQ